MLEVAYVAVLAGSLLAGMGRFGWRKWKEVTWKDGLHTFAGRRIRIERHRGASQIYRYRFRFEIELDLPAGTTGALPSDKRTRLLIEQLPTVLVARDGKLSLSHVSAHPWSKHLSKVVVLMAKVAERIELAAKSPRDERSKSHLWTLPRAAVEVLEEGRPEDAEALVQRLEKEGLGGTSKARPVLLDIADRLSTEAMNRFALPLVDAAPWGLACASLDWLLQHAPDEQLDQALLAAMASPSMSVRVCELADNDRVWDRIDRLVANRLTHSNGTVRSISRALGSFEWTLLDELELLEPLRVVQACRGLARLGTPLALQRLAALLERSLGRRVSKAATWAVARIRTKRTEAREALEQAHGATFDRSARLVALFYDVSAPLDVRRTAFEWLLGDPEAPDVETFRNLLTSGFLDDHRLAVTGLLHYRDESSIPDLITALDHSAVHARLDPELIAALEFFGDERAEAPLIAVLDSDAPPARLATIAALGRLGGSSAARALRPIAGGRRNKAEAEAARDALDKIRARHGAGAVSLADHEGPEGRLSITDQDGRLSVSNNDRNAEPMSADTEAASVAVSDAERRNHASD